MHAYIRWVIPACLVLHLWCITCKALSKMLCHHCYAGGAAYLFYLSRKLAAAVAGVTALLWVVALCYGNFSRKAQRTYQDALAETNQVTHCTQAYAFSYVSGVCLCNVMQSCQF